MEPKHAKRSKQSPKKVRSPSKEAAKKIKAKALYTRAEERDSCRRQRALEKQFSRAEKQAEQERILPQISFFRFFEYIYLYKDVVMYQIEQMTKLCSKISLSEPWDPYDIPDNSTYEDQYYIGGPGDQIMVQEWSDRKPARKLENWVGVYTVKDCYPVQETYTKNYSVTTSTRFFDLRFGISDPSVFIPPSTCQTAQSEKMTYVC
ncbi:Mammalian ependymin-related protein 1, partial [Ophiophagus hannah]